MDLGISGKRALVLASSRGLGLGIAKALADEGAHVLLCGRSAEKLKANAEAINAAGRGKADWVEADLSEGNFVDTMLAAAHQRLGGIDILVNNAAIFEMEPVLEVTEASFDKQFAINVKGLFFTLQAVARQMVAQGRGGKIINMSSQAGRRGEALVTVY